MSSGSLKDITKAIHASIPASELPLPDDLVELIQSYLDKHSQFDESDSQKLHEELLSIYQKDVQGQPERYAIFLAILRQLRPAIRGSGRILQWWDALVVPVLDHIARHKGLASEASGILLEILAYDVDERDSVEAAKTSMALSEQLVAMWLKKSALASVEPDPSVHFLKEHIQMVLMSFGKKRPKDFLTVINKFFVRQEHRTQILTLIGEFFRHGPPHLHQLLETPLFENLLRCLQIDTSTTVVSLAVSALAMFLPHIPNTSGKHLPALFNIYTRMLFWDRERILSPGLRPCTQSSDPEKHGEISEKSPTPKTTDESWEILSYSFDSDDDAMPDLLSYFTFLYGLYPINFMSYIRKPSRYLRHANFPGADDIDVQPSEIRQRSEQFRQIHLLHPNFFHMTIESELSDPNRWMKSDAHDVTASCMALCVPALYGFVDNGGPSRNLDNQIHRDNDIPPQSLLGGGTDDVGDFRRGSSDAGNISWRNTTATLVALPDHNEMYGIGRMSSRTSQALSSAANSPAMNPINDHPESPITPSHLSLSPNHTFEQPRSLLGNVQTMHPNDSTASVSTLPESISANLEAFVPQRSPSIQPSAHEGAVNIAYLQREILLLKNDLNFERYLKQQHLSHIGQLRRKQVRQSTAEAETQNLLNANRGLKNKLEESKNSVLQIKKESEKSRSQARKWEADLTTKLRALREEQKKWIVEGDTLRRDLLASRENCLQLRQMVVTTESRELIGQQKLQSLEVDLAGLDKLRAKVENLNASITAYEARDGIADAAKAAEILAIVRADALEMTLRVRDTELEQVRRASEQEIVSLKSQLDNRSLSSQKQVERFQGMLDSTLAANKSRLVEAQKAHAHLLRQFTKLQQQYLNLHEQEPQRGPLLSAGDYTFDHEQAFHSASSFRTRRMSDFRPPDTPPTVTRTGTGFHLHSNRVDAFNRSPTSSQGEIRSPSQRFGSSELAHHIRSGSLDGGGGSIPELDHNGQPKIKPQSEIRVYGRGGVQNIGKKDKDKKEKEKKEKEKKKKDDGDKKDKKISGLRGIRAFV